MKEDRRIILSIKQYDRNYFWELMNLEYAILHWYWLMLFYSILGYIIRDPKRTMKILTVSIEHWKRKVVKYNWKPSSIIQKWKKSCSRHRHRHSLYWRPKGTRLFVWKVFEAQHLPFLHKLLGFSLLMRRYPIS